MKIKSFLRKVTKLSVVVFASLSFNLFVPGCRLISPPDPPDPPELDEGKEVSIEFFAATSNPDENPCIIWTPLLGSKYVEFTVEYYDFGDQDGDGRVWETWGEKQKFDYNHTGSSFPVNVPSKGSYVVSVKYKGDCDIFCQQLCQPETTIGEPEYRGKSDIISDGQQPFPIPLDFDEYDCCT